MTQVRTHARKKKGKSSIIVYTHARRKKKSGGDLVAQKLKARFINQAKFGSGSMSSGKVKSFAVPRARFSVSRTLTNMMNK